MPLACIDEVPASGVPRPAATQDTYPLLCRLADTAPINDVGLLEPQAQTLAKKAADQPAAGRATQRPPTSHPQRQASLPMPLP